MSHHELERLDVIFSTRTKTRKQIWGQDKKDFCIPKNLSWSQAAFYIVGHVQMEA